MGRWLVCKEMIYCNTMFEHTAAQGIGSNKAICTTPILKQMLLGDYDETQ